MICEPITDTFLQSIYSQMAYCKDDLINKIMAMALGREATTNDYKDFEFIKHEEHPLREFFGYKGILLGEIKMFQDLNDDRMVRMGFTFDPKVTFKELV